MEQNRDNGNFCRRSQRTSRLWPEDPSSRPNKAVWFNDVRLQKVFQNVCYGSKADIRAERDWFACVRYRPRRHARYAVRVSSSDRISATVLRAVRVTPMSVAEAAPVQSP